MTELLNFIQEAGVADFAKLLGLLIIVGVLVSGVVSNLSIINVHITRVRKGGESE